MMSHRPCSVCPRPLMLDAELLASPARLPRVRAVTFDFWQTLLWEPLGQPGLFEHRWQIWIDELDGRIGLNEREFRLLHDGLMRHAKSCWGKDRQFRIAEASDWLAHKLGYPEDGDVRQRLKLGFVQGGRAIELTSAPHVLDVLTRLRASGLRLGIVCDVGLTPSTVLREHLDRHGLTEFFEVMSYSDETMHYKPHPAPFSHVLNRLGVPPSEAVHIGDNRRTDVRGAQSLGMWSIRYTGVYDDPGYETGIEATAVTDDHRMVLELLA